MVSQSEAITLHWCHNDQMASQITSLTIVYSTVYSDADQRKHQSSASLAFVWGIHRGPENSPHKWPVTRKIFPFDDVIMIWHKYGKYRIILRVKAHFVDSYENMASLYIHIYEIYVYISEMELWMILSHTFKLLSVYQYQCYFMCIFHSLYMFKWFCISLYSVFHQTNLCMIPKKFKAYVTSMITSKWCILSP